MHPSSSGSAHRGLTHVCLPFKQKQYSQVDDVIMAEPSAYNVPESTQPEQFIVDIFLNDHLTLKHVCFSCFLIATKCQ